MEPVALPSLLVWLVSSLKLGLQNAVEYINNIIGELQYVAMLMLPLGLWAVNW